MKRITAIILVAFTISGCANLDAVSKTSSKLLGATRVWDDVGTDIYASCIRESKIKEANSDCKYDKQATEGMLAVNAVIANLFKAINATSKESNYTIQPGLDQASAAAAKIPHIKPEVVSAISGLVGTLSKLSMMALREESLRRTIDEGAPNAVVIINGLKSSITPILRERVLSEKAVTQTFFVTKINSERALTAGELKDICDSNLSSTFSSSAFLLTIEYCRRYQILDSRENAINEYTASLESAKVAISDLQSSRMNLKGKDLAIRLFAIEDELEKSVAALHKAYK